MIVECCPLCIYSSHSLTFPHISKRCSFQTVLYSLKSAYACHSFVTTVIILSQICDDCVTAARQQKWTYHFLKNLNLLKWETYISNKTQYNHCFCKCCSRPHGRIHALVRTLKLKKGLFFEFNAPTIRKDEFSIL